MMNEQTLTRDRNEGRELACAAVPIALLIASAVLW